MNEPASTRKNAILEYTEPVDYGKMILYLEQFCAKYPFLEITSLGTSLFGNTIPLIRLGTGERTVLYVASHHAMEWITTVCMLRFINEYCEYYCAGRRIYNLNIEYLFHTRSIYIVPMLNPDGISIQQQGLDSHHILFDRLVKMNPEGTDFSHWQANGRGVDLNHNYNAGFQEYKRIELEQGIFNGAPTRFSGQNPESEPEVSALCNFIRYIGGIRLLLTFHTQGEEIYWNYNGNAPPRSHACGKLLSRMSGYPLVEATGNAAYGGLKDWFLTEFNRPAYTIECGKGTNPLPLENYFSIYTKLREILFTAPILC